MSNVDSMQHSKVEEPKRPLMLLLVYSWDLILAILALLGALAAFGGVVQINGKTIEIGITEQIFSALSAAALAAVLIVVGTLLTRRQFWIRQAQMVILEISIVFLGFSVLAPALVSESKLELGATLANLGVIFFDTIALYVMTRKKVKAWFGDPGSTPVYVLVLISFWLITQGALVLVHLR